MKEMWNERYEKEEFIYGEKPNSFFEEQLGEKNRGKLLLPAEGEGRNAFFASKKNWDVHAFDQSEVAAAKAINYAAAHNVNYEYQIESCENFEKVADFYDAIGVFFIQFSEEKRIKFHKKLTDCLKPGGRIIGEIFSKNQLNYQSGGPKNIDYLYTVDQIKSDFSELDFLILEEKVIHIKEGLFHQGKASVVRFVACKKVQPIGESSS